MAESNARTQRARAQRRLTGFVLLCLVASSLALAQQSDAVVRELATEIVVEAQDARTKVTSVRADAQAQLDRNSTLRRNSQLPGWATDAYRRIIASATAALADVEQIVLSGNAILNGNVAAGGGATDPGCVGDAVANTDDALRAWHDDSDTVAGDVACLAAGTAAWDQKVVMSKAVWVRGVGAGTKAQCETPSQTTYTCITNNDSVFLFEWTTPSTGEPELSHLTVYADDCSGCNTYHSALISIYGTNPDFRLHDLVLDVNHSGYGYTGLVIGEYVRGAAWNMTGIQRQQTGHLTVVIHNKWSEVNDCVGTDPSGCGGKSWEEASSIGTDDGWYFEDVIFSGTNVNVAYCTDDFMGARVTYRFSTFPNCSVQNHGTETGGRYRGMRETVYAFNNWSNSLEAWAGMFGWRGGSGYAHHNVATTSGSGSFTYLMGGTTFRRDDTGHNGGFWPTWTACGVHSASGITRSGSTATVTTTTNHGVGSTGSWVTIAGADQSDYNGSFWGTYVSDTTFTYTVSGSPATPATGTMTTFAPWDGNQDSTGRRCLDGFGVGQGSQTIRGTGASMTFTPGESDSQPVYVFANTLNGSQADVVAGADVTVANRDFFNQNASYNGTTQRGVYVGTTLPTNCTLGDAAWITNQGSWNTETTAIHANHGSNHSEGADGKRYECTVTGTPGTWAADYGANASGEPLAYPHPLRAGR